MAADTMARMNTIFPKTNRSGFALLEVLLVVAILGIIAVFSFPMLRKFQIRSDLFNTSETITQGIARARLLAQSGKENSAWGFSIEHGTLFKGDSYDERDPAYDELYTSPSTIALSGTTEVYFDPLTGKPNAPGSIVTLSGNDGIQQTIDLELTVGGFLVNDNDLILICYESGTIRQKLMFIHDSELQFYLNQGATQGPCPVASSSSSAAASSASSVASSGASSVAVSSAVSSVASSAAGGQASSSSVAVAVSTKGIYLRAASSQSALAVSGNAILTSNNGAIRVNSTDAAAVFVTDNGKIYTSGLYMGGTPGTQVSGNGLISGTKYPGTAAVADPLAALPVPTAFSPQLSSVNASGNASITLSANRTYNSIAISGNAQVTLQPGTYYLNSGLTISGNGKLTGSGVFIYNAAGAITLSGNGQVTLSPQTSGTYAGVTIFNSRTSSAAITLSGNGKFSIKGALYAANSTFNLSGNGIGNAIGSLIIGLKMALSGNAQFAVQ